MKPMVYTGPMQDGDTSEVEVYSRDVSEYSSSSGEYGWSSSDDESGFDEEEEDIQAAFETLELRRRRELANLQMDYDKKYEANYAELDPVMYDLVYPRKKKKQGKSRLPGFAEALVGMVIWTLVMMAFLQTSEVGSQMKGILRPILLIAAIPTSLMVFIAIYDTYFVGENEEDLHRKGK